MVPHQAPSSPPAIADQVPGARRARGQLGARAERESGERRSAGAVGPPNGAAGLGGAPRGPRAAFR